MKISDVIKGGGPSRPTLYRIQNDPTYMPETYSLERLARALGVSIEWLALGAGQMEEVMRETSIPYRTDMLDGRLLGACIRQVMTALNESHAGEVPDAQLGAVVAEIYNACIKAKTPPSHDLIAPFMRVLLA
jgi:hypothetical protein